MVRDCVPLQRHGALRLLTSAECIFRTEFEDEASIMVFACSVPSKGNLLIFLLPKQSLSLVCPISRNNFFLSPFLM